MDLDFNAHVYMNVNTCEHNYATTENVAFEI